MSEITQAVDPLVVLIFGIEGLDEGYVIDNAKFWQTAQSVVWQRKTSVYRALSVRLHRNGTVRNSFEEMGQILGVNRETAYRLFGDAKRMMQKREVWVQYAGRKDDTGE